MADGDVGGLPCGRPDLAAGGPRAAGQPGSAGGDPAGGTLWATGTAYETYFEGAQFVHFLLGPATVALAVPLHANLGRVRQALVPMLAALLAGSLTAISVALGIGWAMGLEVQALLSLAPKSATAPVAMGVAERIGGRPR